MPGGAGELDRRPRVIGRLRRLAVEKQPGGEGGVRAGLQPTGLLALEESGGLAVGGEAGGCVAELPEIAAQAFAEQGLGGPVATGARRLAGAGGQGDRLGGGAGPVRRLGRLPLQGRERDTDDCLGLEGRAPRRRGRA